MNNLAIQPYYRMTELLLFTFSKFPQIADYVILLPDSGFIKQLLAETKAAMLRVLNITSSPLKKSQPTRIKPTYTQRFNSVIPVNQMCLTSTALGFKTKFITLLANAKENVMYQQLKILKQTFMIYFVWNRAINSRRLLTTKISFELILY